MLRQNTRIFLEHINGHRAFQTVAEISTFHRIQASTGYRQAAHHCKEKLRRWGINTADVLSFPARDDKVFLTYPSFKEWDCRSAVCELVTPERRLLCDFDACPMSVIQKSAPCDHWDEPLEVIMLDKGTDESMYDGVDFENKMVFVRDDINKVFDWVVGKRKAAGLITDFVLQDKYVRERHDQSDTLRYTSFWWRLNQTPAFGFVLSPREGDRLAGECEELAKKGLRPTVRCKIDSSLYDGNIEDVFASLPGESDDVILLVGHLCHPRASANDNASGSACVMEAVKTIKTLTEQGDLPPLKRTIWMLLVPEFTGTYAFLERLGKDVSRIKAAFNLDMVGARQDRGYGPITITDLPMETPSFVSDAAATVLDEIKKQVVGMMPESYCPMFNSHMTEYSGGSDHVVLSDPMTNVPCLMLGQWPDKFYHTSSDTLEVVDPYILSRSACLAASYAYSLANLEEGDMEDIFNTSLQRTGVYLTDLQTKVARGLLCPELLSGRIAHYTSWRLKSIDTYESWLGTGVKPLAEKCKGQLLALVRAITGIEDPLSPNSPVTPEDKEKYTLKVKRLMPVPVMLSKLSGMCGEENNRLIDEFTALYMKDLGHSLSSAIDYFIDGQSPAWKIAEGLAFEFGKYLPQAVDAYLRLLVKLGYAEEVK